MASVLRSAGGGRPYQRQTEPTLCPFAKTAAMVAAATTGSVAHTGDIACSRSATARNICRGPTSRGPSTASLDACCEPNVDEGSVLPRARRHTCVSCGLQDLLPTAPTSDGRRESGLLSTLPYFVSLASDTLGNHGPVLPAGMRMHPPISPRRSLHCSGRSAPSRDEPLTARLVGRCA
jgi:hypothetical protein